MSAIAKKIRYLKQNIQAVETLCYCTCYTVLTEICFINRNDIINIFLVFLFFSFDLNDFTVLILFGRLGGGGEFA
jgi:hypothetical protein